MWIVVSSRSVNTENDEVAVQEWVSKNHNYEMYTTIQPWYGKLLSIDFMVNDILKSILEIVWS